MTVWAVWTWGYGMKLVLLFLRQSLYISFLLIITERYLVARRISTPNSKLETPNSFRHELGFTSMNHKQKENEKHDFDGMFMDACP